jgi:DNA-binding transcriptional LysR family regulator
MFCDQGAGMVTDVRKARRRIRLRDLDTFMAVVSAGGMRRAAGQLHLSQPAVSKAIAELESELGVPLLERGRQGVAVTPFGQALAARTQTMFDALDQGMRDVEHLADPDAGEVNIACPEVYNAGLVATAMEHMSRRYPRVRFGVDSGDAPVLISQFLLGRVSDVVIARPYGPLVDPAIRAEPLLHERLQVVVHRDSPWAKRRKVTLAELAGERWILSRNEANGNSPVIEAFRREGMPLPACWAVSGSLQMRFAVLPSGPFVTVMPRSFLRYVGNRYPVKVLPIEIGKWAMPTMLLTLANRAQSPAATKLIDTIRELARSLDD